MKKLSVLLAAGMVLVSLHIGIMAEESPDSSEVGNKASAITGLKLDASGAGYIMFGQIVSGYMYGKRDEHPMEHEWLDFYGGNIIVNSTPNDWFNAKVGLEVRSDFPISTSDIMKETYKIQYSSFLPRAEGIFHWNFNNNLSSLLIESGIFQYNFNPEIKNLGNYLYRGIAYPLFLETKLDYPWYDMFGIRSQVGFLDDQIKVEGIINSEIKHAPFYDFSLAFTATYTAPQKIAEIGLGVCFNRLWSVDEDATLAKNLYSQGMDSSWSLRATKFDSRLMFDVKPLFGNPEFFGRQDCKIYGEASLLGLTDPKYFPSDSTFKPTLLHRLPILFGINVPGFKIMDLISFEVEWFDSPYSNDWWGGLDGGPSPVPNFVNDSVWNDIYKNKDNFKWTVYLKKSFSKFDFIGIAANDHTIYNTFNAESQSNTEQSLRKPSNWHWYIKLQYNL
jgi:hypothetical protein